MRSVGEIAANIIGARVRWFYVQFGEVGDEFNAFRSRESSYAGE